MERIRALNRENNETTCATATDAATKNEKNIEVIKNGHQFNRGKMYYQREFYYRH